MASKRTVTSEKIHGISMKREGAELQRREEFSLFVLVYVLCLIAGHYWGKNIARNA